ncbi:15038_t:CDS:1, partial [Gigaspora margarita]
MCNHEPIHAAQSLKRISVRDGNTESVWSENYIWSEQIELY